MSILQTRENHEMAYDLLHDFKHSNKGLDYTKCFMNRTHDTELAEIGAAYVGPQRAAKLDEHILVWTGYEVLTASKYLAY